MVTTVATNGSAAKAQKFALVFVWTVRNKVPSVLSLQLSRTGAAQSCSQVMAVGAT